MANISYISSTTNEGSSSGAAEQRRTDSVAFRDIVLPATGGTYLGGALFGAVEGSIEGVRAADAGETLKTRLKRVLSSSARAGMSSGGRTGIYGLIFSCTSELIERAMGSDGVPSRIATMIVSGVVWKAGSGPRAAAMWGVLGGIVAAGMHAPEIYRHHTEQNPPHSLPDSGKIPAEIVENQSHEHP